ncbi:unnamed protein product [Rotaria socialis]|uniref:Rab3-GAP regulatory subunit N-terminal domain-containing protein n=1 Tax=Rotaria socialis TaxID=392032 RepID=A0A818HBB2_9BILA|nr:unnamed protein product [Rotaria socialis]CAF3502094.1 unnamed protein product [Rotaria socialis]
MACSLNIISKIDDLSRIRAVLLPHLLDSIVDNDYQTTTDTDATEDDEIPTAESVARTAALLSTSGKKKNKISRDRNQWLNDCQLAFSPTLNLLVIGFDQHIVVSTAKSKVSSHEQSNFIASFDTKLQVESNERITSVLCIPVASSVKRSSHEWTCVIVGFTTGYVRMYTEDGILLFSQIFHDESVAQLKCHTQFPSPIRSLTEQPDELYIRYISSILVVIDGLSLYQLLKVCRDHVLKSSNLLSSTSPQLSFKKWSFPDQNQVFDFVPAGLITDNRFDQFCVASMRGGYQAQIRAVPPLFSRLVTIGAEPYCNFYYCAEGAQMPHLTEVAFALADKVKSSVVSAVSRFFPLKQATTNTENRKVKIESDTKLDSRFCVRDLRRHGEKIIISPGLHIAAVCDSFGRIIIYDVHRGIAIRMFKGYREAEIGFIQIEESTVRDTSMSLLSKKSALFLVIHAPKRQLVEIWGCQQGARVAAFNVSKNSRLIYLEHYTLGWATSGSNSSKLSHYKQCILLEENGDIKTFEIPFHLILSDRNNQRAHDLMVVRQVRRLLKDSSDDNDSLKTDIHQQRKRLLSLDSQSEILDILFHTDYLNLNTLRMFIDESLVDLEKTGHHRNPQECVHLQDFCDNALNLLNIYTAIEQCRTDNLSYLHKGEDLFSKEDFQSELNLTDDETTLYYQLFEKTYNNQNDNRKKKVHFLDETNLLISNFTFGQFQSMFLSSRHMHSIDNQLEIKSTINSEDFSSLGLYLFSSWFWFSDIDNIEEKFRSYLQLIHLKNDDVVLLCLHSLLSIPLTLPKAIHIWKKIFSIIYSMNNNKNLLKSILEKSANALTTLLLTLIFRLYDNEMNLTILVRRLSALVAIQNLYLSIKNNNESIDFKSSEFTVESIFIKHRYDYLLELITRRMMEVSMEPSCLVIVSNDSNLNSFQSNLLLCRQILPHTFEPTVLLVYCSWICMTIWHKQLISPTNPTSVTTTRTPIDLFNLSLLFYNHIQIGIVKQNLGTLLWHTYIRPRIVTLTQLIEKIGKVPKDRLCYKELHLNEKDLIIFLEQLSKNFFNTFIDSIYNQLNEIPIFNNDDVWQSNAIVVSSDPAEPISPFTNLFSTSSVSEQIEQQNSLLELVMEQKPANGHLVLHHDKLIFILYYLMYYHIKSIRPYSLFDSKGIHAFFTDLYSHPLVTDDVDGAISNKRQLFFARLLNTIFEQHDNTQQFDEKIFDNIVRLSTDMLVDHEYIRRHYISLLYAYNYDSLAINEENRIYDRQALAFQLLIIAGLRLNYLIEGNIDATTKMSSKSLEVRAKISSTLKTWLTSLVTLVDYKVQPCSLDAIQTMLTRIACYLPQTNLSQSNLAQEMLELVNHLKR